MKVTVDVDERKMVNKLIFDHSPGTWRELEEMVYQAFNEMGYTCTKNKEMPTIRGKIKIDVYAVKKSSPIPTVILCECKYWDKRVEQNVIHSFRSICSDVGAHYGLIISKKGFQSGAESARGSTNIHLLDFIQFQNTFFEEWRSGIFMNLSQLFGKLLPLMPGNPNTTIKTSLLKELQAINVFKKYSIFFGEHRFPEYFILDGKFPFEITDPRGVPSKSEKIKISSPREYVEVAKKACVDACEYFGI